MEPQRSPTDIEDVFSATRFPDRAGHSARVKNGKCALTKQCEKQSRTIAMIRGQPTTGQTKIA